MGKLDQAALFCTRISDILNSAKHLRFGIYPNEVSGESKEKVLAGKVKRVVTVEWSRRCSKLFFLKIGKKRTKRRGSFEDMQLKIAHRKAARVWAFVYSGLIQPK
jgi:hypothetical protein